MYLDHFFCIMKKLFVLCFASFLVLGFLACSSDEEQTTVYDYDELPAWLVPQAKEMMESFKNFEGDPSLLYGINRTTGIHGEKVYHIYRIYDSCWMCNLYDENGNSVDYTDVFGDIDDLRSENWVLIFPKVK